MEQRLEVKAALVTGASGGIGRATAARLGREGAAVGINYRSDEEAAGEAVREITEAGGRAIAVEGDVSKEDEVKEMVRAHVRPPPGPDGTQGIRRLVLRRPTHGRGAAARPARHHGDSLRLPLRGVQHAGGEEHSHPAAGVGRWRAAFGGGRSASCERRGEVVRPRSGERRDLARRRRRGRVL
ncbi:MAG: SDR family NAD(P)-dependent oxidoreductase [Rubrobacter sp.]|nr:SDR family NAD(P)-dependent oxidoreductase [Rubrobacteraceae bacterium]MBA3704171.1 SDR family NAD(P)-dependent oxidoreductase [Rubrobacteraceae bacterium]MBA3953027.1 SDR family NAD(P)-dependent oxidoreductase [Rubrobacter sp.]